MTTVELLKDYVKYNLWANRNLADVLRTIDQSWMIKEVGSSFRSLRMTCFHIWDAEYIWLCRLKNETYPDLPSKRKGQGLHGADFITQSEEFMNFILKQDDSFFSASTSFKTLDGDPYTMSNDGIIMHVVNHSSFHRGQLVTMLRNLGFEGKLPRTDMIIYLREKSR